MNSESKEHISIQQFIHKNDQIPYGLRREYSSNIAIEFLYPRKENEKLICGLNLKLPLKLCSSISQDQISSLIYRCKTLRSLSIKDCRFHESSRQDDHLFNNIILSLKTFRSLVSLRLFNSCSKTGVLIRNLTA